MWVFQPVKFVSVARSIYLIVMFVRFSPCVCWLVFLTSWFLNTVRAVFCFYLMKSARCNGRNVVEFFFNKYITPSVFVEVLFASDSTSRTNEF